MDLLNQLGVAESSTKTKSFIPVRRFRLTQEFSFVLPQYFFNEVRDYGRPLVGESTKDCSDSEWASVVA